MMAAVRILIWLPVRLVRPSSISNMAFFPSAHVLFPSGCRAYTPPVETDATLPARRTEECDLKSLGTPDLSTEDCGCGSVRVRLAAPIPQGGGRVQFI